VYQGVRAKNTTFNVEIKTNYAPDLPNIEVVPQEIGRVLLNLYNNAFYAVSRRASIEHASMGYQPTIWVSSHTLANAVEIRVKDNGVGIAESVRAKIFQPFFTTKPTGEGTGLGLSLSYDIVTNVHGGTLTVDSCEGQGAEFVITLRQK
jgi:signal transduction histidine kinase